MTFQVQYEGWEVARRPLAQYRVCSPALVSLRNEVREKYGLVSLGCHGVRPVRGGTAPSVHSWGAAIDLSYRGLGRAGIVGDVLPWLVGWSGEWGIQAIHDYVGSRIWHAGRTATTDDACDRWWRAQRRDASGMGQSWGDWLHVEVHPNGWGDGRSAAERGVG